MRDSADARPAPHSVEAEQSVLGSLLMDPSAWLKVSQLVTAHDFYRTDHQLIFSAIERLARDGKGHDSVLTLEELKRTGDDINAGGLAYLGKLVRETPTSENIAQYVDHVKKKSEMRCREHGDVQTDNGAETPEEDGESSRVARRIAELARLSRVDYDRIRKDEAKTLGIQLRTLDTEVSTLRKEMADDPALTFEDPEPWPAEVDGAELLNGICAEVERYLVLPPHASTAVALWALHTWCLDAFFITPFLYPRSPEKRCGKTTLMLLVHELVRRPLLATNASQAALFRCIEEYRPTLLLDEADTWLRENEELRGILNGGHSRKTARVIRTVGEEHEVRAFSTYCPKAIAGIGRLADTLEDRSIVVPMKRKRVEDRTAP